MRLRGSAAEDELPSASTREEVWAAGWQQRGGGPPKVSLTSDSPGRLGLRVNGFCSPKGRAPRKEARAETGAIALPCAPRGWTVPVRGPWGAERTGSVSAPELRPLGERRLPRTWPLSTWRRFQGSPVPQEGRPPPPSLPDPSSLPFHGTRTSPEPVAPGAGFLAVGERRRGGLSENPALEASSSQARPRKALTPSLTRRAPVRGGARPGGFGGCHTVVRKP